MAGATLGNDVNLRDFEGRSALLLGKAKDNNASCAIGPFIRLFDETFSLDDVRQCDLALTMNGPDGFEFTGRSSMREISRDPLEMVEHAIGPHHQYPDGLMLFLGTMFAPTVDRFAPGKGFTHVVGDLVTVSTPTLGTLVNRVNHTDKIAPWTFGVRALMDNLRTGAVRLPVTDFHSVNQDFPREPQTATRNPRAWLPDVRREGFVRRSIDLRSRRLPGLSR